MFKILIFVIFFVFPLLKPATPSSCPEGSYEWQTSCYFFQNQSTGFADAESICAPMGGHLVSIHDGFTNTLLSQKAQGYFHESTITDFWIGLTDLDVLRNWTWMDGNLLDYKNWGYDEPQNVTGSYCASLTFENGLWKSDDCYKLKPYICKVDKNIFTPTTTTTTPQYPTYANCTYQFIYFEPTHSCYGYGNWTANALNWSQSEQYCQHYGGHLASIHSYEEARLIGAFSVAMYTNIWIGGYSNDGGNTWKWSDGTPWENKFWYPGYPKLNASACIMASGNSLIDYPCESGYRMICKIAL